MVLYLRRDKHGHLGRKVILEQRRAAIAEGQRREPSHGIFALIFVVLGVWHVNLLSRLHFGVCAESRLGVDRTNRSRLLSRVESNRQQRAPLRAMAKRAPRSGLAWAFLQRVLTHSKSAMTRTCMLKPHSPSHEEDRPRARCATDTATAGYDPSHVGHVRPSRRCVFCHCPDNLKHLSVWLPRAATLCLLTCT